MGYPADLAAFKFDPTFAIRGLIFDKKYGNFVKVRPPPLRQVSCSWGRVGLPGTPSPTLPRPALDSATLLATLSWCATVKRASLKKRLIT